MAPQVDLASILASNQIVMQFTGGSTMTYAPYPESNRGAGLVFTNFAVNSRDQAG